MTDKLPDINDFTMEAFLTAIEAHPKACAFLLLMAILTCTFRFKWVLSKEPEVDYGDNKEKE